MKIQKGQKLTEKQKAQRAESRRRNTERCLRDVKALEARNRLPEAEGRRFVIEVTEEERQALFEISRRKFVKQHPCIDGASLWAIKFALCHSEQYLNWISGILSYERAEGLNQFDQVKGKIELVANHLQEQWVD